MNDIVETIFKHSLLQSIFTLDYDFRKDIACDLKDILFINPSPYKYYLYIYTYTAYECCFTLFKCYIYLSKIIFFVPLLTLLTNLNKKVE